MVCGIWTPCCCVVVVMMMMTTREVEMKERSWQGVCQEHSELRIRENSTSISPSESWHRLYFSSTLCCESESWFSDYSHNIRVSRMKRTYNQSLEMLLNRSHVKSENVCWTMFIWPYYKQSHIATCRYLYLHHQRTHHLRETIRDENGALHHPTLAGLQIREYKKSESRCECTHTYLWKHTHSRTRK